jgi:hypothetical protein
MKRVFLLLAFCQIVLPLAAQQATATPAPAQPSVRFSFAWSQGVPWTTYVVEVRADGKTHFNGTPHPDGEYSDTDPVNQDFTMWEQTRQKIFGLAQKLNYFQGDLDSHLKRVAQTGKKTLEYQSPQTHGSASFNYSQNPDAEELYRIFNGISMTIEYGQKLAFQYRFDKLGLDRRLKELEGLQASHGVEELHVIAPILRKIAADPNLMNISRDSARHILKVMSDPPEEAQRPGQ